MKVQKPYGMVVLLAFLVVYGQVEVASTTIGTRPQGKDYEENAAIPLQVGAGNVYYVDYENGDDNDDGLTMATPWKHAPGDPNAVGNPATIGLQPGDTVLFKGGLVYRGNITLNADGTAEQPIVLKGDGWGGERAIIDGSEILDGVWTQCESQETCRDNPNWQNIYCTDAPQDFTFFTALYQDDEFLWFSQDPNPKDPFYYDRIDDFRVVPLDDPAIILTRTSLTDPRYLTQTDPNYWDGAYIAAWRIPNVVVIKGITGFDPDTDTIFFEDLGNDLYTDRDEYYSLLNHLSLLDKPGEYYFDAHAQRIYVWPLSSEDPSSHQFTVAKRRVGIDIQGHSNIVIEGLKIQKYFAESNEWVVPLLSVVG